MWTSPFGVSRQKRWGYREMRARMRRCPDCCRMRTDTFGWAQRRRDGGSEKWGHYGREKGASDVVTLWPTAGAAAPDVKWRRRFQVE